ncbi:MAG: c-type cytochrome biogenesis protein CcmI [Rhodospirillaceae bacterium]
MTVQIILSVLLAFIAAAFVVLPLLRRPEHSVRRADYDLQVYKDQLGEIDRDVERGLLNESQAEAARVEIQRRMLAVDAEGGKGGVVDTGRGLRIALAVMLGVLVPVGAIAVYGTVGAPGLPDRPIAAREGERLGLPEDEIQRLRASVVTLEASTAKDPKNQDGWLSLAEAHSRLQQWPDALRAYDKVIRLGNVEPEVWSSLGEAHVFATDGTVGAPAEAAFRNALRLDRREPRARYYLGLARSQQDEPRKAMAIWREISATSPPDAPWMPMLRQRMGGLGQQAGIMPASVRPVHALDLFDAEQRGEDLDLAATGNDDAAVASTENGEAPGLSPEEQAMVDGMVKGLAERLAANPEDYDGWMRLGRSYGVMRRFEDAAEAYGRAAALRADDVESRFGQAGALLAHAESSGAEKPPEAFFATVRGILAIEPDNAEALYYAGLGAALDGQTGEARRLWGRLLDTLPADSPQRPDIEQQIRALPPAG